MGNTLYTIMMAVDTAARLQYFGICGVAIGVVVACNSSNEFAIQVTAATGAIALASAAFMPRMIGDQGQVSRSKMWIVGISSGAFIGLSTAITFQSLLQTGKNRFA